MIPLTQQSQKGVQGAGREVEAEKVAKAEVAVEVEEVHKEEEDDELNSSEKVQYELEREQGSEVDREADPTWPTRGEIRATRPLFPILTSRRPLCFLD